MNVFGSLFLGRLANLLTALVSMFLLVFNSAPIDRNAPSIDLNDYRLVFADEFDGESLDSAVWGPHNAFGKRKGGYWSASQAKVADGKLVIKTEYKEDGEFGSGWYTCGLSTKGRFEQKYGYFECRAILPKGQGLWSAFWMTNSNVNSTDGTAKNGAEIDIFESPYYHLGGERAWKVTHNLHYNGYGVETKYKNVGITELDNNPYENYNTYGMLWTPEEYIFFVNGYEVGRSSYGGVSEVEEFLILSCEVDGAAATPTFGWSGNIEKNDKQSFSSDFIVDYVRVYQPV